MPEILEYPRSFGSSLRAALPRRAVRRAAHEVPLSVDNEKDMYLHVVHLSSAKKVQENWPRIVRHAMETVFECSHMEFVELAAGEHGMEVVVFSAGQKAVVRAIRDFHSTKLSWEALSEAAARLTETASRYESHASGEARHESFVRRALRLDQRGQIDAVLDLLYDGFDELLRGEQYEHADALLSQMPVEDCSVDILLGVLTATLPARSRLPSRAQFYRDVESSLQRRGEAEDGLLTGLS